MYSRIFLSAQLALEMRFFRAMSMNSNSLAQSNTYSMSFVTAPNEEVAKKIASGLVSNKLAACVNIIPKIISVYEWEDKINTDAEVLMMIKSRSSRLDDLTEFVKKNHPYDVCEVISNSIEHGNSAYLDWIGEVVPPKK